KEFFERYRDPMVIQLGKRTEVYTDPEIDMAFPTKIGTRLEIITKTNHYTMFEEDKPSIPHSFIKEKFMALATNLTSDEKKQDRSSTKSKNWTDLTTYPTSPAF
ncbi:MAG: hypothetical protein ACEROO_08955, partial [Candidatus Bathyarchaeota archaeon]